MKKMNNKRGSIDEKKFYELQKKFMSPKKHFRSQSNNGVEKNKSKNYYIEQEKTIEYEKEISLCEYLTDDSNNRIYSHPQKLFEKKKKMNIKKKIRFEINNQLDIDLNNEIFQRNIKRRRIDENTGNRNDTFKNDFLSLIYQFSDNNYRKNNKKHQIFQVENEREIIKKIKLINLNLNFHEDPTFIIDNYDFHDGEEEESCRYYQKFNDSYNEKKFNSLGRKFDKLSLNIVGMNKDDYITLKKYIKFLEQKLEILNQKFNKNEEILKFILEKNKISDLFNSNLKSNKTKSNQIDAFSDEDLIVILEQKISYIEKELDLIKFMINSKKKTSESSINKFKVIKSKDILAKIGSLENTLRDGFNFEIESNDCVTQISKKNDDESFRSKIQTNFFIFEEKGVNQDDSHNKTIQENPLRPDLCKMVFIEQKEESKKIQENPTISYQFNEKESNRPIIKNNLILEDYNNNLLKDELNVAINNITKEYENDISSLKRNEFMTTKITDCDSINSREECKKIKENKDDLYEEIYPKITCDKSQLKYKIFENFFKKNFEIIILGKYFQNSRCNFPNFNCNNYENNNQNLSAYEQQEKIKKIITKKNNIIFLIKLNEKVNNHAFGFFYSKIISYEDLKEKFPKFHNDPLSFLFSVDEKEIYISNPEIPSHFCTNEDFLFSFGNPLQKEGFLLGADILNLNNKKVNTNYIVTKNSIFGNLFCGINFFENIEYVEILQVDFQ